MKKILNFIQWKFDKGYSNLRTEWKLHDTKIYNLDEYRKEVGEDRRWVRHFLWYQSLRNTARRKRLERERRKINWRNLPPRR